MDKDIVSKVESVLKELTLEEKASLCSGADFWNLKKMDRLNIPSVMVTDGPHGLRKETSNHIGINKSEPATCFPTAAGLAATWDTSLIEDIGKALGEECLESGVSVLLGPAVNIKRSPLCGRNFEYFSEDPYLAGELAAAMIEGIQSMGIGTSLKHFAANNQEKNRMTIDTLVDERALREIYLYAFEKAVRKAHPWTIMASYNKLNGTFASENKKLLTDILRQEWGFDGIVMSDWGAVNDRVKGLKAGMDLEMPGDSIVNDRMITEAVKNGSLDESILDASVSRLLTLIFKACNNKKENYKYSQKSHHELARKAAAESMVLLKNKDNILPVKSTAKIALIGEFARKPRYQGAGSSLVNPLQLENAYETGKEIFKDNLSYAQGYNIKTDAVDKKLLDEALDLAGKSDIVIIMAGLTASYESEGFDRSHIHMPLNHNRLIEEVSKVNKNVIVVLNNGSPVDMPWIDDVSAIIEAYLPGEAGGSAIWDVILGDVNPSGRLPESFPLNLEDNISYKYFPMGPLKVEYRESIFTGYRYFDTAKKDVLFPFGYGLSYTDFVYSNFKIDKNNIKNGELITVSLLVKNNGARSGKEVVQLYVRDIESSVFKPEKELKGFRKISLEPGEEKEVSFLLDSRSFAYYNVEAEDWQVEDGEYLIILGSSSRDIKCEGKVYINSSCKYDNSNCNSKNDLYSYYNIENASDISQKEFAVLYGKDIDDKCFCIKPYNLNSAVCDVKHNLPGWIFYKIIMGQVKKQSGEDKFQEKMFKAVVSELPLRGLVAMSSGVIGFKHVTALIHLFNGNLFKCIKSLTEKK